MSQCVDLVITSSMATVAAKHGFLADLWEYLEGDKIVCTYRGFVIALITLEEDILGVSFRQESGWPGFSMPTEFDDSLPGYEDEAGHIALAKAAIDEMLGPEPDQLSLVED